MDAGSLKLTGAIVLFCAVAFLGTALLTGRRVGGQVLTRGAAQFISAVAGAVLGVVLLLALG
ncbi:MAG TPA: hypothetical protein VD970_17430 [Acetobacteraceae bacterium]|nr:hypothetical protein [Acetobacteraceae bacterium]